jgi:hypothetical protein
MKATDLVAQRMTNIAREEGGIPVMQTSRLHVPSIRMRRGCGNQFQEYLWTNAHSPTRPSKTLAIC